MGDREVSFLDLGAATAELRAELAGAMARVTDSGWYVGGEEVAGFERRWAAYCQTDHAVGASNGLDALSLALRAVGVRPGDEVIVPSWTFIATWLAVSELGARPVAAEVDARSANLDPGAVAAAVGPRTRAVVVVHLYGRLAPVRAIAEAVGPAVAVIEDAAQAHGARNADGVAGGLGRAAAFSFYPAKNLGALGDAGAVTTDDGDLAQRVRQLGNYGAHAKYDHAVAGRNARLDPLQAAVLAVKLAHLDAWNARRAQIAVRYRQGLAGLEWLRLPPAAITDCVWHLFVVRCRQRDALMEHLRCCGVVCGLHYPRAPHQNGAYASLGLRLPEAERWAAECLSLPIGPHLSDADADRVVDAICSYTPR